MRTVIVGAGPAGLYTAVALARRGHEAVVIDRDSGPDGGQRWDRRSDKSSRSTRSAGVRAFTKPWDDHTP